MVENHGLKSRAVPHLVSCGGSLSLGLPHDMELYDGYSGLQCQLQHRMNILYSGTPNAKPH